MSQTLLDTIRRITPTSPADMRQLADQHLTSDDPQIRLACLEAITRLAYTSRYDDLNYLSKDADKWIRIQTLRALIAIGEDDEYATASDLITYFGDPEPIVRLEAIYTMHHLNLRSYIEASSVVKALWDDDARVWESRGETIRAVMLKLFGKYDAAQFNQAKKTGSFISVRMNQTTLYDDMPDSEDRQEDDISEDVDKTDTSQFRFIAPTPDLTMIEDSTDTELPTWLDGVGDTESDSRSHSLDDLPDWMSGDVDGTLDDFTTLIHDNDASSFEADNLNWLSDDSGLEALDFSDDDWRNLSD